MVHIFHISGLLTVNYNKNCLVGPILVAELGKGPWMYGETFTALDVVFGCNMYFVFAKREWFFEEFSCLKDYFERIRQGKTLFSKAFAL